MPLVLRRIHGPVVEQGIWRVRTDQELRELCKCLDTGADIGMDWAISKNGSRKDSQEMARGYFEGSAGDDGYVMETEGSGNERMGDGK